MSLPLPPAPSPAEPPAPIPPTVPISGSVHGRHGPSRAATIVAGVVAAVVIAAAGFGGGYVVGKNAASTATNGAADTTGAGGSGAAGFGGSRTGIGGPGASGRGGAFARGGGGTTAGTITSVAPDQVTVSLAAGGSKLVLIDGSTTVTKVSSTDEALTDLSQGEAITVIGTANPDGSITAQRIVVGNVSDLFGGGLRRNPAPSPSASSAP